MSKKALRTDTFREIKKTANRFFSILIIVAMGVGFFVGVKATAPSMMQTAESFYDQYRLMDLKILSNFGFSEEDVEELTKIEGVSNVMPSYSADLIVEGEENNDVVKVMAINLGDNTENPQYANLNLPDVVEGRLPEKAGECVVETSKFITNNYQVGDTITFAKTSGTTDVDEIMTTRNYTVVGKVKSPMYISYDHGTTYVGNGTLSSFILVPTENFTYSRYTEIYVSCDTGDASCFSDSYDSTLKEISKKIDELGVKQYQIFETQTKQEIADAEKEFNSQKEDAQEQLDNAGQELDAAKQKIEDALKKLEEGRKELEENEKYTAQQLQNSANQIATAKKELEDSYAKLQQGEKEYAEGKQQLEDGWAQYYAAESELESARQEVASGWAQYNEGKQQLEESKQQLEDSKQQIAVLEAAVSTQRAYCDSLQSRIKEMEANGDNPFSIAIYKGMLERAQQSLASNESQLADAQSQISQAEQQIAASEQELERSRRKLEAAEAEISAAEAELENSRQQLEESQSALDAAAKELETGKKEYDDGVQQVADAEKQLEAARKQANVQLEEGRQEIEQGEVEVEVGQKELTESEKKYEEAVKEAEEQISDGNNRIQNAKKTLGDIGSGVWYPFTRDDNPGYSSLSDDAARTDALAAIFPVFFLLVALLVCLTTMTRMVEEQRGQMGTLKAMGYSSKDIVSKYFTYSTLAGVIGSVIGVVLGTLFLPKVIMSAYSAMYDIPPLRIVTPWASGIAAIIVALLCTTSVALFTCYQELKQKPAQLMRPKAPKDGKRILLERFTFLWKRMSFSHKVTARNLFRYKGRLIMTVLGIAGCTALITAGLGLQDAIAVIVPRQFEQISDYDAIISLRTSGTVSELKDVSNTIENTGKFERYMFTSQNMVSAVNPSQNSESEMEVYLFVPQSSEQLSQFIQLHERTQPEVTQTLSDTGVIISEKISSTLQIGVGDTIEFTYNDKPYSVTVEGITENYVYHYIYISPTLFKNTVGESAKYNSLQGKLVEDAGDKSAISEEILKNSSFTSVVYVDSIVSDFTDTIKSLDAVVFIMIFAAGALAFVVLYNLTNINISERVREIATIKVLGFYNKEVNMYVFRENIVMTIIGIVFGLLAGAFLSGFMVQTIEMDMVMFGRQIDVSTFFIAGILTLVFTMLVNLMMSRKMKKIHMVESLKSVE